MILLKNIEIDLKDRIFQGSILVAGITHAAGNTAAAFIPLQENGLILILTLTVLVLIIVDRMWRRLPTDHPAVFIYSQVSD